MNEPKIRMTGTAHIDVPPEIFHHLNDVVDCISWRADRQYWECVKDDMLVELRQFKPRGLTPETKAVYDWLKAVESALPGLASDIIFYEMKN